MDIGSILVPLELDNIDQVWNSTKADQSREYPTLFVCNFTDNHKFNTSFAWIDIPPPLDNGSFSSSYAEFGKL